MRWILVFLVGGLTMMSWYPRTCFAVTITPFAEQRTIEVSAAAYPAPYFSDSRSAPVPGGLFHATLYVDDEDANAEAHANGSQYSVMTLTEIRGSCSAFALARIDEAFPIPAEARSSEQCYVAFTLSNDAYYRISGFLAGGGAGFESHITLRESSAGPVIDDFLLNNISGTAGPVVVDGFLPAGPYSIDGRAWASANGNARSEAGFEFLLQFSEGALAASEGNPAPRVDLLQNHPNPIRDRTTIPFTLSRNEHVVLKIFSVDGREIATLVDRELAPGHHDVRWRREGIPKGIYFYRLAVRDRGLTRKLVVLD